MVGRGKIFSPENYYRSLSETIVPQMSFSGNSLEEWGHWRKAFKKKYIELLGRFPEKCDLNPVLYRKRITGIIEDTTWIIQTENKSKAKVTVLTPQNSKPIGDILCCHGHAYFGRHNALGHVTLNPVRWLRIKRHNYGFAKKYAENGFRTVTIDMRGFNERGDGLFPYSRRRDKCNVSHIKASLFGYNLVTFHLWDHIRTLDFMIEEMGAVADKIGVTGISLGGTISLYLAALDKRISHVAVSGALTTFKEHSIKCSNTCGSQFIPGICQYGELADIAGLIAPRPVHFSNGVYDYGGFSASIAESAFQHVKNIYQAAGVRNKCTFNKFIGKHSYDFESSHSFFKNYWGTK